MGDGITDAEDVMQGSLGENGVGFGRMGRNIGRFKALVSNLGPLTPRGLTRGL